MKSKLQTLLAKVKRIYQIVKWFFIDCFGWCTSVFILAFKGIRSARMFYGNGSYKFAIKYAEKRARKWRAGWDQMGKLQGLFPIEDRLLVCSPLEIKHYQKEKILSKQVSYRKMFKRANYYKTKLEYNGKKR